MIYAVVALSLAGVLLLAFALRGRRIDTHPICRRCRFDLVGICDAGARPPRAERCPECGASLSDPPALRLGNRKRCPRLAAFSIVLLLAGLISGGILAWGHATGIDWNRHKPAWWLAGDLASSDPGTGDAAVTEFARRIAASQLTTEWRSRILDIAMMRYLDEQGPWSQPWGELLAQAWQSGLLTDEQELAYLHALPQLRLAARQQTAQEMTWSPHLQISAPRAAARGGPLVRTELISAELNGQRIPEPQAGRTAIRLSSMGSASTSLSVDFLDSHPPGAYTFSSRWRITLQSNHNSEPLATWEAEYATILELLPKGAEVVQRITAPHLADQMQRSVRLRANIHPAGASSGARNGMIFLDSPPMPAAFRMYCRALDPEAPAGYREWFVGSITASGTGSSGTSFNTQLPHGLSADAVDILLRACPHAAARTPHMTEIWDGDIIIRDVAITSPETDDTR